MTSLDAFLQHESQLLEEMRQQLQTTLHHCIPNHPHGEGARRLLALTCHQQTLLETLFPYKHDRLCLLERCYELIMIAVQQNHEAARSGIAQPSSDWTLVDDIRYYTGLVERLNALPNMQPQ